MISNTGGGAMTNKILIFLLSIWGFMGSYVSAQAFVLQNSVEFAYPHDTPYPNALGQPIDILPQGYVTITVGDETYYYSQGVFFQKIMKDQKYLIVPPPIGAIVFSIPQGYQQILVNGMSFYEYQGVYYKQVLEGYKVIYPPV